MVKIAFFELEQFGLASQKKRIKSRLKGHKVVFIKDPLDNNTARNARDASILAFFINSRITPDVLKKIPKAKLLATMSTGYDHINLPECRKRNITVCNVPSYGENTVAEHAMALLLSISRKIIPSVERTKKCNFSLENLRGFDLQGKTIGIIGTGKIGRHMINYARAFGMRVIAYDLFPNNTIAKETGFTYTTLERLLSSSDVISIHVPESPKTHHLINKKNINRIKKGCVLINTARGGIIETEAIIKGLKEGILSACGLDVLEEECVIKDEFLLLSKSGKIDNKLILQEHVLIEQENVIITPHNAFNSKESIERILETTLQNITDFVKKKTKNKIR